MNLSVTANVVLVCVACSARRPILFDAAQPWVIQACTCGGVRWAVDRATAVDAEAARALAELFRVQPLGDGLSTQTVARYVQNAIDAFKGPCEPGTGPFQFYRVSVVRTPAPRSWHLEIRPG